MALEFSKLEGAGNDYVVLDGRELSKDWNSLSTTMSRQHFGIGSDGLIVVENSATAQTKMRVFNPDGSEAEMSGNGIRLFAKFVIDNGIVAPDGGSIRVETLGGERVVWPTLSDSGKVISAKVSIGKPDFSHAAVGLAPECRNDDPKKLYMEVKGIKLQLTCLSIGNPHAVAVLDQSVDSFPFAEVGDAVESNWRFLNRINFEAVNILDCHTIRARIFERGAGETLSSGTGSSASAIAAMLTGRCGNPITVRLDGGELAVSFSESGETFLEGPARLVFIGSWNE